jgi:hypothetical protein
MAPFEALYRRKCRSPICWYEPGASKEFHPDYVKEKQHVIDIIWDQLKIAQSRQKSYADSKRRIWEPQVGDMVYLRVSPMKGVHRFWVKGNLSPRYTGPFKIQSQSRGVAFELELPKELSKVHNVFHASQLVSYLKFYSILFVQPDCDVKTLEFKHGSLPTDISDSDVPSGHYPSCRCAENLSRIADLEGRLSVLKRQAKTPWIKLGSLLA